MKESAVGPGRDRNLQRLRSRDKHDRPRQSRDDRPRLVGQEDDRQREINGTGSEADTTVTEVPPADPVKDNLVAFARAICGEALYPITGEDLVNNISILEAIITSAARDGEVVKL